MLFRPQFVSAFMIAIFFIFLLWLYSIGKINATGILGITVLGVFFVLISNYFYKNYWDNEE
jgi:uncharacterized membrane protein (DUF106 family)